MINIVSILDGWRTDWCKLLIGGFQSWLPDYTCPMTYQLDHVTICRDGLVVLENVNLALPSGQVIGLVGPNGVGKSTLLAALAGDIKPDRGQILLEEAAVGNFSPAALACRRAIMAQQAAAIFNLSVRQVLELGLHAFAHWRHRARETLLLAVAQAADVAQWLSQSITSLSVGQQQRVHFARALLQAQAARQEHGQAWLLLDEPAANQDPWQQQMMMSLCREFVANAGAGVLLVLHDLTLVAQWCDEIVVLKDKGVLASGQTRAVLTAQTLKTAFGQSLDVQVMWQPVPGVIWSSARLV